MSAHDRNQFLDRIANILTDTQTPCYGWVLMRNHVHLLLRTGQVPIATIMRRLLTSYAMYFNRQHRRHGQVFQNRYKSILCEEDPYLRELVRYIHLNPLRAKAVKDLKALSEYPYSGHSALMGKAPRGWQDTEYVLKLFGDNVRSARRSYAKFVANGIEEGRREDLTGGGLLRSVGGWRVLGEMRRIGLRIKGDERILGSSDFVLDALKKANEDFEEKYRLRTRRIDLDKLTEHVAEYFRLEVEDLKAAGKTRRIVVARSILCYLASKKLGYTCAEISRHLHLNTSNVSRAVVRVQHDPMRVAFEKGILHP
jgi:REP element-mobilizing transposase RayT